MRIRCQRWIQLDDPLCVFGFGKQVYPAVQSGKKYADLGMYGYDIRAPWGGPLATTADTSSLELQLRFFEPDHQSHYELPDSEIVSVIDEFMLSRGRLKTILWYAGDHADVKALRDALRAVYSHRRMASSLPLMSDLVRSMRRVYGGDLYNLIGVPPNVAGRPTGYLSYITPRGHWSNQLLRILTKPDGDECVRYLQKWRGASAKSVAELQESLEMWADQCTLLYPLRPTIPDDEVTPLALVLPSGHYFESLPDRFPDRCPRVRLPSGTRPRVVESYAYRGFLFFVDANAESVSDIALQIKEAYDKEANYIQRLRARIEAVESGFARERISDEVRVAVWRRDEGKCQKCGSREKLEYDHIIPVSKGGSNTERNIQLLCEHCNRSKHASIA